MSRPQNVRQALAQLIPLRLAEWFNPDDCQRPVMVANAVDLEPAWYSHMVAGGRLPNGATAFNLSIRNPSNSGVIMRVDKLIITAQGSTQVEWRTGRVPNVGSNGTERNRDLRQTDPPAGVAGQTVVAPTTAGTIFDNVFLSAGVQQEYGAGGKGDRLGFILPPDTDVTLNAITPNITVDWTWYWREISIEAFRLAGFDDSLKRI